MYDTLKLFLPRLPNEHPFEITRYLTGITEHQSERRGYSCTGEFEGFHVSVGVAGTSLQGSLAKFALGNNIESLTRNGTKFAIEKLSDGLHSDMGRAKVTRLDAGMNISTSHKPFEYYRYLGNAPFLQRSNEHTDTLYYKNGKRTIVFYDKGQESIGDAKKVDNNAIQKYGIVLRHTNLLRYELRFMKDVNGQLNNDVRASTLSNTVFYRGIAWGLYERFAEIQKLKKQTFMIEGITSPREAKDALLAIFLQQDKQDVADDFFNALKAGSAFEDRKYYSRFKSMLNELKSNPRGIESDLMSELDCKIYNTAMAAMDE